MTVSKDTIVDKLKRSLFPPSLENKLLIRDKPENFRINTKHLEYLKKYLETRNPDFLIKAVKEKPALRNRRAGRKLDVENFLKDKEKNQDQSNKFVDAVTIVSETIRWYQQIIVFAGEDEQAKEAKVLLTKMREIDIYTRKETVTNTMGDGFLHITKKEKGKHPYLTYESPEKFIEYFDAIKAVFNKRRKRYYKPETQPSALGKISDQELRGYALVHEIDRRDEWLIDNLRLLITKHFGDKITKSDLKSFDLSDVTTITASYIAWKHEIECIACKKLVEKRKKDAKKSLRIYRVGYKTIIRLYKKAIQELENIS